MTCNCIDAINEKLAPLGRSLRVPVVASMATGKLSEVRRVVIETEKTNASRKPFTLFAVYCPFCGERYDGAAETAVSQEVAA